MVCTGIHTPAQNIAGKNTADPMAPAIFVVRDSAEITAPRARAARTARTRASTYPKGCSGRRTSKARRPTARASSADTRAAPPYSSICADSRAAGRTGVVDIRRRMPRSR